jgi:hypothetical protein
VKLSSLVKHWARQTGEDVEYAFGLLSALQKGVLKDEKK